MVPLQVEVAYVAEDGRVFCEPVTLDSGQSLQDAIDASGVLVCHPEIDLSGQRVGIYGQQAALDTCLTQGDRVEIYRPLTIDPKQKRRQREHQGKN